MSDKSKPTQVAGLKATITIQQYPGGLAIGLDLNGEKLDMDDPKGIAAVALVGVDAMRDHIRENFNVQGEAMARADGKPDNKTTTH